MLDEQELLLEAAATYHNLLLATEIRVDQGIAAVVDAVDAASVHGSCNCHLFCVVAVVVVVGGGFVVSFDPLVSGDALLAL